MTTLGKERRHTMAVLAPMAAAIALLVAVCVAGLHIASAVRAYVGGESLWSKGRSEAVIQLQNYARLGQPQAYQAYLAALAVPLGDRQARLELDKPDPSLDVARAGFLQGGNAPEDVEGLIRLYRMFRGVSFMEEAIAAWTEGDRLMVELQAVGDRVRSHVQNPGSPESLDALIDEVGRLNARLVVAEKNFSETLGRASRTVTTLLVGTSVVLGLLLVLGCTWFVRRSLQRQLNDQRQLEEANRRWELAADVDGLGLFEWWVQDDRYEVDHRGRALYGFKPEDGTPQRTDVRAMHHPDDVATVRSAVEEALRNGGSFRARYRVRDPDIGWRHVEATGQTRDLDQPARARMVGIVRDITAELQQAQLRADKELAERTAAARMAFLSRLSHELRTPLNAILGLTHLLAVDSKERLTENQGRRVKLISDSGRNLLRLVEDVLDLTHIDAGKAQVVRTRVDLVEVVRDSLPLVDGDRALRRVRIEAALPDYPVWVMGDRQRLQQVVVNLLSNACKYNRPEGRVTLRWKVAEEVSLAIADEGAGMKPTELAELFQAFKRFAPAPDVPGSGVGLMVVQMLVDQMRGRIEVTSTVGVGSCFTVHLPAG